jgi:DNA-binding response OmpR family regulator
VHQAPGARAPVTILAVDDDAEILWSTVRILTGAGFQVVTGEDAASVVDLAHRHRPALILLDVNLGDGSGIEVARMLKGDPQLAGSLVVLLSGSRVSSDDQVVGLSEGLADGYITRPIGKLELLARIEAFLRIRGVQEALRASEAEVRALNAQLEERIAERTAELQAREQLIVELREAGEKVKLLSGLIPICAHCKKIRDDKGYWNQIEVYIRDHSEASFTHGICPECAQANFPGVSRG